ncbi:MAG: transcriptional repressor [Paludibacteraceae bacterium]|nr:transcriptional repressor [Paludibacteraceae bacterium]
MSRRTAETKYPELKRRLDAYVRENSMRQSPKRDQVLQAACELGQPFAASQLIEAVEPLNITGATVYNILSLFVQARILHTVHRESTREHAQYEVIAGRSSFIQIKCSRCGRETTISSKPIANAIKMTKIFNFETQRYSLFLYGECKKCRSTKRL